MRLNIQQKLIIFVGGAIALALAVLEGVEEGVQVRRILGWRRNQRRVARVRRAACHSQVFLSRNIIGPIAIIVTGHRYRDDSDISV